MSIPAITPLANLPSISDPTNFDPRAENFLNVQLPNMVGEINAANAGLTAAIVAALDDMDDAVAEAKQAAELALIGTSTSSVSIGTGSKTFTTQSGRSWAIGTWLNVASRANPTTHWMIGQVTAYSGTSVTISVQASLGSGSRSDWDISLTSRAVGEATTTAAGLMSAADKTKLNGAAPLASPAITGTPTAPTASTATSNTQIATTAFVKAAIAALAGSAPAALDTLVELAAALGNDPNFATTVLNALATKLADNGDTYTKGYKTAPVALTHAAEITPSVDDGHIRTLTNSGAFKLNAPSGTADGYTIAIVVTNAASGAGAMTASGFTKVHGTFATTANAKQLLVIEIYGAHKILSIRSDT